MAAYGGPTLETRKPCCEASGSRGCIIFTTTYNMSSTPPSSGKENTVNANGEPHNKPLKPVEEDDIRSLI